MRSSVLHRLIALLLLMAYTITGTSALPAAVALLAAVDGDHEVLIGQGEGGLKLTLHHSPGEYTPCVEDHRSALARVLVRFCRPSEDGDHQLSSARMDANADNEKKIRTQVAKRSDTPHSVAVSHLWQMKTDTARTMSCQGVITNLAVLRGPEFRPVLSTVQMLV